MLCKYGKCTRQLKIREKTFFRGEKRWPLEKNGFAAELTEDEVTRLLDNATPKNTKKGTNNKVWHENTSR